MLNISCTLLNTKPKNCWPPGMSVVSPVSTSLAATAQHLKKRLYYKSPAQEKIKIQTMVPTEYVLLPYYQKLKNWKPNHHKLGIICN